MGKYFLFFQLKFPANFQSLLNLFAYYKHPGLGVQVV